MRSTLTIISKSSKSIDGHATTIMAIARHGRKSATYHLRYAWAQRLRNRPRAQRSSDKPTPYYRKEINRDRQ